MPSGFDDHRRCPRTTHRGTLVDIALLGPNLCGPVTSWPALRRSRYGRRRRSAPYARLPDLALVGAACLRVDMRSGPGDPVDADAPIWERRPIIEQRRSASLFCVPWIAVGGRGFLSAFRRADEDTHGPVGVEVRAHGRFGCDRPEKPSQMSSYRRRRPAPRRLRAPGLAVPGSTKIGTWRDGGRRVLVCATRSLPFASRPSDATPLVRAATGSS